MSKSRSFLFFLRNLLFATFLVLVIIRTYTCISLLTAGNKHEYSVFQFVQALFEDVWLLVLISLPLYLTGLFVSYLSEKLAKALIIFCLILLLFIHIGFTEYFLTVHQLVDSSIYFFSLDELSKTVGLGERFSFSVILALLTISLIFYFTYRYFSKKQNKIQVSQVYFYVFSACIAWIFFPVYNSAKEESADDIGAESNVSLLFLHSSLAYLNKPLQEAQIRLSDFEKLDSTFTNGPFAEGEYPLFRTFNGPSTLANRLNKTSDGEAPKIVFVIVEGLSSDLVGEQAKLTGHLMPFLDSLSAQSIYFPNTLSTSQRTQNVLPSTLCSVPNVREGAVFQQMSYPNHWSILGLLKNDYQTRFSCGVQLEFMNMRGFMNHHSVHALSDNWNKTVKAESELVHSPWGVPDGGLFQQNLIDQRQSKAQQTFDVLLTISTHDPFVYPEKEKFTALALKKFGKLKNDFKKGLVANAAKFGSYAYLDREIGRYFRELKKRDDFKNTIFIVTGDHGSEMWNRSPVSKYHVPFIIYSPLLKEKYTSKQIVSHLDLTPTLHAYLKEAYGLELPSETPYIGKQLPFGQSDEKRSFLFTTDQLKNRDVFFRNMVLVENKLYTIDEDLNLEELRDEKLKKKILEQREWYKLMSRYVLLQNKLIPPKNYYAYYELLDWKKSSNNLFKVDRVVKHKGLVEAGTISSKEIHHQKIRIRVDIHCQVEQGYSSDSLPDLIITSERMTKVDRSKTIYRLIRPSSLSTKNTRGSTDYRYELSFNSKQLAKLKNLGECYVYLYYKMKKSPLIIDGETVISTIK